MQWGPFVHGDQFFGDSLSIRTLLFGDRLSMGTESLETEVGDQMDLGPIALQPIFD